MSQQQILATVQALLEDATEGLAARTTALAAGDARIRSDFHFVPWQLSDRPHPTQQPNVMLRPRQWQPGLRRLTTIRDAQVAIEIGYEYFGTDAQAIQDNVTLVATALAQVLDGLRDYSDAHGGTVIDVLDPLTFAFGQFSGPTSNGFLCTVTLEERSGQ